jgi:hypothetical protein
MSNTTRRAALAGKRAKRVIATIPQMSIIWNLEAVERGIELIERRLERRLAGKPASKGRAGC